MDVFSLLRRDHGTVSSLFTQIQRGFAEPPRRNVIGAYSESTA